MMATCMNNFKHNNNIGNDMSPHQVDQSQMGNKISDYEVTNLLGRGAFACVYRARCRLTNREVAIKVIDKKTMRKSGMVVRVRNEVEIQAQLKHSSILELYHCFEDTVYVYLVLELCLSGELSRYVKTKGKMSEDQARIFMHQIVDGMLHLHAHGIIHRDLTLSNMLLDNSLNIKIADFGLATKLSMPTDKHFTMCGTPNFISPEIATRSAHGLQSDVWSLGCMLYTFLVGSPPFDTDAVKSTLNKVVLGDYQFPPDLGENARDLIQRLLRKNPSDRITLSAVLDHSFMTNEWEGKDHEDSIDSGLATMTTNSTNWCSRVTGSKATPNTASRLPPRTRPFIVPHPNRAEPCLTRKQSDSSSCNNMCECENCSGYHSSSTPCHKNSGKYCTQVSESCRGKNNSHQKQENARENDSCKSYLSSEHLLPSKLNPPKKVRENSPGRVLQPRNLNYERGKSYSNPQFHLNSDEWKSQNSHSQLNTQRTCSDMSSTTENTKFTQRTAKYEPHFYKSNSNHWHGSSPSLISMDNNNHLQSDRKGGTGNCSCCNSGSYCFSHRGMEGLHKYKSCESLSQVGTRRNEKAYSDPYSSTCSLQKIPQKLESASGRNEGRYQEHRNRDENAISHCRNGNNKENIAKPEITRSHHNPSHSTTDSNMKTSKPPSVKSDSSRNGKKEPLPTINSKRLRAIRQKTKNSVLSILDSGEVCLETVKIRSGKEVTTEVLRISEDGKNIKIYTPKLKTDDNSNDRVPSPTPECSDFTPENVPSRYINKYRYLAKFVTLVRSKTPKVTLFTSKAKCMLMENDPNADLEVCFYDGSKIHQTKGKTKIIDSTGRLMTLDSQSTASSSSIYSDCDVGKLPIELQDMVRHAMQVRQKCLNLESAINIMESTDKTSSYFPITVSRRPAHVANTNANKASGSSSQSSNTRPTTPPKKDRGPTQSSVPPDCLSPNSLPSPSVALTTSPSIAPPIRITESVLSYNTVATGVSSKLGPKTGRSLPVTPNSRTSAKSTLSDGMRPAHRQLSFVPLANENDVVKSVNIPNIGFASHLRSGDIWVQYHDQSQIMVQSSANKVLYSHPNGKVERFGQTVRLPEYVKDKLAQLPYVVELLVRQT
ncbi:serine/threonine-protein kinase PLK4-like isoform X2 [Styela clava]